MVELIYLSLIAVLIILVPTHSQNCPTTPCPLAYTCNNSNNQCENIMCPNGTSTECSAYPNHPICDINFCVPNCDVSPAFCVETWGSSHQYCNPATGICDRNIACPNGDECSSYSDYPVCEIGSCFSNCTVSETFCLIAWGDNYPLCNPSTGICDVGNCPNGDECSAYPSYPICDAVHGVCRREYNCAQEADTFCATNYADGYVCEQSGDCMPANCINTAGFCDTLSTNAYGGFALNCNNNPSLPQCELGDCATDQECKDVLGIIYGTSMSDPLGYCDAENKCERSCVEKNNGCAQYYGFINERLQTQTSSSFQTGYEYICNITSEYCVAKPCQQTTECTGSNQCVIGDDGGICSLPCTSASDCDNRMDFWHFDHNRCDAMVCRNSPPSLAPTDNPSATTSNPSQSPSMAPSEPTSPVVSETPEPTMVPGYVTNHIGRYNVFEIFVVIFAMISWMQFV